MVSEEYNFPDVVQNVDISRPAVCLPSHRRVRSIPVNFHNPAFEGDSNVQAEDSVSNTEKLDLEKDYDPHDYCVVDNPTSFWGTVFHFIILMGGPGVLSIPSVFVGAGYLVGAILMPCLFYLYVHNANMFIWTEYELCKMMKTPTLPYPEVAYHAFKKGPKFSQSFSKWARRILYVDFVIVWYSYYCYNFVIVSKNLQVLYQNVFHVDVSISIFLEIITIPMLLLTCVPKLKYLVPVSFIGMACNGLSLVLIVYYIAIDKSPWQIPAMVGDWNSIPLLIGVVLVNVNMGGILIPLKNEMKQPRRFASSWFSVLTVSYTPTAILYSMFCLVSVLKYGNSIKPSVIENLPQNEALAQIGIALSSIAIICQQPLGLVVSYDIIWDQILKKKIRTEHPLAWEYVLRIVLVFLAFLISMTVPNIDFFLSIGGTVGTSIDSLIMPAAMYTVLKWKTCESKDMFWFICFKNIVVIIFAVILAILGCMNCIDQLVNHRLS